MFDQGNRPSCKYHLSAVSTLVFYPAAVFLLLIHCGGQAEMIGSSTPLLALIGEDILLPCRFKSVTDIRAMTLEWARLDLNPRFVHLRREGVELLVNQNPSYKGRTSLSTDKLQRGDMSLMLSKVKLSDEGEYRCHIPGRDTLVVKLVVGSVSSLVIIIQEITAGKTVVECESKGWYPEPEVLWLDHEGKDLSAGPTETLRGPDGLYSVSSRVTVEMRQSDILTCRVHQRNITQTRETRVQFQDEACLTPPSSAARITVFFFVSFLLLLVVLFVLWKRRQQRGNDWVQCSSETPGGRGEEEQLVKGGKNMKGLEDELQEKEEETNDMLHVISIMEKQKTELESSKAIHISKLKKVEEEWKKNEKKINDFNNAFHWNKDVRESELSKVKMDLENKKTQYKKVLKSTVNELQNTRDRVSRMTKKKEKVKLQIDEIKKALNEMKRQQDENQERLQLEQTEREEETQQHNDSVSITDNHYNPC